MCYFWYWCNLSLACYYQYSYPNTAGLIRLLKLPQKSSVSYLQGLAIAHNFTSPPSKTQPMLAAQPVTFFSSSHYYLSQPATAHIMQVFQLEKPNQWRKCSAVTSVMLTGDFQLRIAGLIWSQRICLFAAISHWHLVLPCFRCMGWNSWLVSSHILLSSCSPLLRFKLP